MTVNIAGVEVEILIGSDNQNWSACYYAEGGGLTIGYAERDTGGLLPISGRLRLAVISNPPESMNPRSSTGKRRFCRGQRVIINVRVGNNWYRHPCGYSYMAKSPLPYSYDRPYLDIELVCALDLQRFPQPPALIGQPAIGYGTLPTDPITIYNLDRNQTITNCLVLAGTPGDRLYNIGKYPYKEILFSNPGSGYVDYAGKVAYGGVEALYQDNQGAIRDVSLAVSASIPLLTVEIGKDEVSYEPIEGGETPVERATYEGVVTGIKGADPGKADPGGSPDRSQYLTSIEYGPVRAIDSELGNGQIIMRRTSKIDGKTANGKFSQTIVEEPLGIISSVAYPKNTGLSESSFIRTEHTYDPSDGKLLSVVTTERQPFVKLCSAYWSRLPQAEQDSLKNTNAYITTLETHEYDEKKREIRVITTTQSPVAAVVSDENHDNPLNPQYTRIEVVEYRIIRADEWEKTTVVRQPTIIARPNTSFSSTDPSARLQAKLALYTTRYDVESSTAGQTVPNATETKPIVIQTEPRTISASATFQIANLGFSERERIYKMETPCAGTGQLQELAQIVGSILIGRAQGARIQLPLLTAFLTSTRPLQNIAVIETEVLSDGKRKNLIYYQMDGIEFTHQGDRAIVTANLIWLGTQEGTLVPHTSTPIAPTFSAAAVIPPYTAIELDYATDAPPTYVSAPELTVITPTELTVFADAGLGLGGEGTLEPGSLAISVVVEGGLGLGGIGLINEPIFAQGGIGIGGEGTTFAGDLIAQGGIGMGGIALLNDYTLGEGGLGLGGQTVQNAEIIAGGGIGLGAQVVQDADIIAQGGIGIGAENLFTFQSTNASNFMARTTGSYSDTDKQAIDNFFVGLETDGLLSTIDCLYIVAAPSSSDALLNWKQNSFNLTVTGSPTFTANQGYSNLSASNYLRTNFVPSTAGGNFTQNSATMGVYNRVNATGTTATVAMGAISSGPTIYNRLFIRDSSNGTQSEMNGTSQVTATSQTDSRGLFIVTRTASNAFRLDRNGSQIGSTATTASSGNQSVQIYVGCQNNNGTAQAGTVSTYQFSAIVLAGGWTTTQSANFYSRLQTYMTYKGINV